MLTTTSNATWWCHQVETFSELLAWWIPLTKASDTELWCCLWSAPAKRMRQQSRRRWFETPSGSLWPHCKEIPSWLANHFNTRLWQAHDMEILRASCGSYCELKLSDRDIKEIARFAGEMHAHPILRIASRTYFHLYNSPIRTIIVAIRDWGY